MKLLLFIILTLFVAVSLTILAIENPGYVLLVREPWSLEMPLTLFALLLVVAVAALYFVIYLLVRLWHIPQEVSRWRKLRHNRRAYETLSQGLTYLFEGSWKKAEKRLLADLRYSQAPLLNYIAAAYAAQAQGDSEKRSEYLSLAHQNENRGNFAIGMTQAHLHYFAHQYEQALAILTQLRIESPHHSHTLSLLTSVYQQLNDWASLANLIPELRKNRVMPASDIETLELETHRQLLTLPLPSGATETLERAWQLVPKNLRDDPTLVGIYTLHLINQGEMDKSETLLNTVLKRTWSDNLVYLYGQVRSTDLVTQLQTAEKWLTQHPNDPVLLLTLGYVALANKHKAKAQEYWERSIALREMAEAYDQLARLLEQTGQTEKAREYYRHAIRIYAGKDSSNGAQNSLALNLPRTAYS